MISSLPFLFGTTCFGPRQHLVEPENISHTAGKSKVPAIAVDQRGKVFVTWEDYSIGDDEVLLTTKTPGDTWSTPVNVSQNAYDSRAPSIAIDSRDRLHMAWQQSIQRGHSEPWVIFCTWQDPGDTWAIPDTIDPPGMNGIPSIAVDSGGTIVNLFWNCVFSTDAGYTCYARKLMEGGWQDFVEFPYVESLYPFESHTCVDRKGVFHVVQALGQNVYYQQRSPDVGWSERLKLSHGPSEIGASEPSLAISRDGSLHVVWTDNDSTRKGFGYCRRTPAGNWMPVEAPFAKTWKRWGWQVNYLRAYAAVLSDDRLCVLLSDGIEMEYVVRSEAGVWSDPVIVANAYLGWHPCAVAGSPNGRVCVAYEHEDAVQDKTEIYYFEFEP